MKIDPHGHWNTIDNLLEEIGEAIHKARDFNNNLSDTDILKVLLEVSQEILDNPS